jgi:hypothetical protein
MLLILVRYGTTSSQNVNMTVVYSEGALLRVEVELEGGCFFSVECPLPPANSVLGDNGSDICASDLPDMDGKCLKIHSF